MKPYRLSALIVFLSLTFFTSTAHANWDDALKLALKNGGGMAVDETGKVLFEYRSDEKFMPASTIKVATAAYALDKLGADYRFMTNFYLTDDKVLVIKGYGDPFMVSEELALIAANLKRAGLSSITGILVDDTAFDPNIDLDGDSHSTNPYDALNGAVVANFNTINVIKNGGSVTSAEAQTPITPIARELAAKLGGGKQRINLGKDKDRSARYAGELLAEFLKNEGLAVSGSVLRGEVPSDAKEFYQHKSSKTVSHVVEDLLEYSTNFMANQLFLFVGAQAFGSPATEAKSTKALQEFLADKVGWRDFTVMEGSGLSRKNQVTPKHMIALLNYFEPHEKLLPIKEGVFRAKTGTLTGASTLIGYFNTQSGHRIKFALMVNDAVGYAYKFKVAKMLYNGLGGN
jgi:D-alanyl-D-alanine carboxypeptidase/D-alanyl-D-alanine-endopeptidase (penicillin-binding protein 4)